MKDKILGAITLLLTLTGCGAIKMYPGPALGLNELTYLQFSTLSADVNKVVLDGAAVEHPGRPLTMLPGRHTLEVGYSQRFDDADHAIITKDANFEDERSGIAILGHGSCTISFEGRAGQSLVVTTRAGQRPLLAPRTEPVIEISESGLFSPVLFRSHCSELAHLPSVRIAR